MHVSGAVAQTTTSDPAARSASNGSPPGSTSFAPATKVSSRPSPGCASAPGARRAEARARSRRGHAGDHGQQRGHRGRRGRRRTTSTRSPIDQDMLDSLPVFDHDFVAHDVAVSRCRIARQRRRDDRRQRDGSERAERQRRRPMQQIRINQDPYSAEYSRPGRGRIEILTKPGRQQYHGDGQRHLPRRPRSTRATRSRRPSRRSSGASTRGFSADRSAAAERRRSCCRRTTRSTISRRSSSRSGRRASSRTTCRSQNGEARCQRQHHASARATRHTSRSGRTTSTRATRTGASAARRWRARRRTSRTTSSRSPIRSRRSSARRSSTSSRFSSDTSASRRSALSPDARHRRRRRVHRRRRAGRSAAHRTHMQPQREPRLDARAPPGPGGLPAARLEPARVLRSHQLRRHVLLREPRRLRRRDGRTRSSSSRATATSRSSRSRSAPTSRTTGRCGRGLSIGLGLRYDWQNYFHDNNNVAPRVSIAYAPGNRKTNVLRAGVGVFNDRSGPVVIADVLHSQPGGLIALRHHRSRLSRSVCVGAASPRRSRRASCSSRPTCRFRRRCSTASGLDHQLQKATDAVGDLHRRARLSTCSARATSTRRRRRSISRARIRRTASCGKSNRPAGSRATRCRSRCAAQCHALVQRPDAVHAEPRRTTTRAASARFRRMTTISPASGRAPTSTGGIASTLLGRITR